MNSIALVNGSAILPDRILANAVVVFREGIIRSVSTDLADADRCTVIDVGEGYIAPGFIDMHVHGGAGADFMDGTTEAVRTACLAHLKHGTTTIFPTTTTGSPEQIHAMLDACRSVRNRSVDHQVPNMPGVHLYGPFFAEDKVGCHSQAGRRTPKPDEYQSYFDTGLIRIATCAAELDGSSTFYETARAHDCFVTCGHSNASWSEMERAFDAGMRHVDHFWCAMSSIASLRARFGVPMQASMAEFVLMHREMSTEVIADGWHLTPELLEFAYRMLGPQRLCLVTDCNRALDMPAGRYRFGNSQDGSWLRSDGHVGWAPEGGSLASSIVGMDHMVRQMAQNTSAPLHDVVRMASLTPAERTGIDASTGSITVGKQADLLVLKSNLDLHQVFVQGIPQDCQA